MVITNTYFLMTHNYSYAYVIIYSQDKYHMYDYIFLIRDAERFPWAIVTMGHKRLHIDVQNLVGVPFGKWSIYTHLCIYIYVYICVSLSQYIDLYVYKCICMYTWRNEDMYIICISIYLSIYPSIHLASTYTQVTKNPWFIGDFPI